jgi:hypothetical protein
MVEIERTEEAVLRLVVVVDLMTLFVGRDKKKKEGNKIRFRFKIRIIVRKKNVNVKMFILASVQDFVSAFFVRQC